MNIDQIREYCLKKNGVSDSFPFNETSLVFKVGSKMFCFANLDTPISINLKCNPEYAIELREEFEDIIPGFHMNKKHWNTISLEGSLDDQFIEKLIDDSYLLVYNGLTKKEKEELKLDK